MEHFDRNLKPLKVGQNVKAQYCSGRYGQTELVEGELLEIVSGGGIYIKLKDGYNITQYARGGCAHYKGGDHYYVCGALHYDYNRRCYVGYHEHKDFEHGHTSFLEIVE